MADTLHLEIVTAGGAAVDTQAAQVTLPLADGEAGILPGHAPLLGAALGGLLRRQGRKGGIEMQIRRMQQLNHGYPPS